MSRRQQEPLRAMTEEEETWLQRMVRATREPATPGSRAQQLVAVAAGQSYSQAARRTGRRSGEAVAQLGRRLNREGVQALERRGGGGAKPRSGVGEREQIVAQARRCPQPTQDGAATWSLQLLQRALGTSEPPHLGRLSP